jgi:hypothetical protein
MIIQMVTYRSALAAPHKTLVSSDSREIGGQGLPSGASRS